MVCASREAIGSGYSNKCGLPGIPSANDPTHDVGRSHDRVLASLVYQLTSDPLPGLPQAEAPIDEALNLIGQFKITIPLHRSLVAIRAPHRA